MKLASKITPCIWFNHQAEEAARFYTSIFPDSKIGAFTRYGKEGFEIHGQKEGTVLTVEFQLAGQSFTALNGGPMFKLTEAVSFQVHCDTQAELDGYWEKLSAGGDPESQQCGWLKDQFGLSWQVVPSVLPELLLSKEPGKSERVMAALLKMKKLDIAALERA
jgi:predicted 3-demethylubiquinone-9 3-methyltransferase (glyoxalase superfamily)